MEPEKQSKLIEQDIKEYTKLKRIAQSADFDEYRNLVLDLACKKIFGAFTGDTIKDWDGFLKTRAEVVGLLLPLQEIVSAEAQIKRLREQLDTYYN